jgi:hypothetical protein
LSEEISRPLSARGSADEREEGTTGPHLRVEGKIAVPFERR